MTQDENKTMLKVYCKHIRTFLSACKLKDNLTDLLNNRYNAAELDDLTTDQAYDMYKWLEGAHRAMTTEPTVEVRRLRSKVLTLMDKLCIGTGNNWVERNSYLLSPKIGNKLLYMMNVSELKTLERRLYGIINKSEKRSAPREPAIMTPLYRSAPPS